MSFYFGQFLTGLASASSLFLVASGLSIIFGVTRIVNFAHGSLYMLGAYIAFSLVQVLPETGVSFWAALLIAALAVGLIGALIEIALLRRIYAAPELFQLVATFGVVLIVQDAALAIWGPEDALGPRAPGLDGVVRIFGEPIPEYDLFLIAIGPLVLGAVWLLFNRTRWGVLVRAATEDREMVAALGVNQSWLFTSVFFLGAFLAGLGGALQVPREPVTLLMDLAIIADVFVVVVIGGMGSVLGAFLAAALISQLKVFGILVAPGIELALPFLVMAVVLALRPWGLLGRPESAAHAPILAERPLRALSPSAQWAIGVGLATLLLAPLVAEPFAIVLATDILIVALFAASLHFMMGPGGMASFGHAAYFGLAAYGAAMATKALGAAMVPAMAMGVLAAVVFAAIVGWISVRRSGVYLAMLTLAAAQIIWSIAYQWQEVTGGDDGILGVWPAAFAADKTAYYYMTLIVCVAGFALIRRFAGSPLGYAIRGGRDSPLRAEAIGIHLDNHQWAAFVIAGGFAGVAGALFVFSKGSIFPDELAIPRSVDGLIMVLMGGLQSLFGPLLGAAAFTLIEDWVQRLDYWRFIFGLIIVTIVTLAPDGLAGGLTRGLRALRWPSRWTS